MSTSVPVLVRHGRIASVRALASLASCGRRTGVEIPWLHNCTSFLRTVHPYHIHLSRRQCSIGDSGDGQWLQRAPQLQLTWGLGKTMEKLDAGLRPLDHCAPTRSTPGRPLLIRSIDQNKLPSWRYKPRQWLIPLVRWETPYLAALQKMRTPALDSYFAITANLGTHTFFMVVLPILFWCGYTSLGRGYGRFLLFPQH
jgi:hypothetical protein